VATITSAQSGDFSDPATWVGGVVPGVGDVAVAATGHVIVIDVDVTVDQVTTTGGTFTFADGVTLTATNATAGVLGGATGIGAVTMSLDAPDSATIIGNVRGGGIASSWGVEFTGTGSLTINGQVTGGTFAGADATGASAVQLTGAGTLTVDNGSGTAVQGGTGTFARGIRCTAAATITVTGNITAGSGSSAFGLQNSGSATITVTGNITASFNTNGFFNSAASTITVTGDIAATGNGSGLTNSGASTITINGNISGGNSPGLSNTGASTITVTGDITSGGGVNGAGLSNTGASTITVIGTITGAAAAGLQNTNASAVIEIDGALQASATQPAVNGTTGTVVVTGPLFTSTAAQSSGATSGFFPISGRWYVKEEALETFFIEMRSATVIDGGRASRTLYVVEGATADSGKLPAASDVRSGVVYGFNDAGTGTCAVPPPAAVGVGVPVDATTGEAVIRQADAAAIFGAIWEQG
jgi:fibronectin-binding autotransporter adhesin